MFAPVHALAATAGRDVARNARLYMAAAQAADDATIAAFEAKYHYAFWRPITAIRNGDVDGHDYTDRVADWESLVETPLHPAYPGALAAQVAAIGAVLKAEAGGALPALSISAGGGRRSWKAPEEQVREVVDARVHGGVNYRSCGEAGAVLGRKVGEQVAARLFGDAGQ